LRAGALDSIQAGSYQSVYVGRVRQSRDTLIYIKNPCRINGL
jgi:hypothetical protein